MGLWRTTRPAYLRPRYRAFHRLLTARGNVLAAGGYPCDSVIMGICAMTAWVLRSCDLGLDAMDHVWLCEPNYKGCRLPARFLSDTIPILSFHATAFRWFLGL